MVYAELAGALIQDNIAFNNSHDMSSKNSPTSKDRRNSRRKSRRGSATSASSNGGSLTPKAPETSGFDIYGGGGVARDFEGVGGWRIPGSDDEDELWTSMNSRYVLSVARDLLLCGCRSSSSI